MLEAMFQSGHCKEAATWNLQHGGFVCPAAWFLRAPGQQEVLAVGLATRCLTLATSSEPAILSPDVAPPRPALPLFTAIKMQLGILNVEVSRKDHLS
jgi:hypothetical protein